MDSTQDRILAAAAECFSQWGFRKTPVDAIAERAGVAKGTVYLHCENKEDLFYQAVHRQLRDWLGEMSRLIDPRVPAGELMLRIGIADVGFVERHPLVRDLLFGLLHGQLPEWSDELDELRQLGQKHIVELLELGIRQGVFAADLDVPATARVLQDLHLSAVLLQHRTKEDTEAVRRHQVAAFRLVLKGLETRSP